MACCIQAGAAGKTLVAQWGASSTQVSTLTWYLLAGGPNTIVQAATITGRQQIRAPVTLEDVVFQHDQLSAAPVDSIVYTLLLNGVATPFTKTIASNDTTQYVVTGSVALVIGDVLQVSVRQGNATAQGVKAVVSAWATLG